MRLKDRATTPITGVVMDSSIHSGRPTLLIADDDAVLRRTIGALVGGSFDVVGLAADAQEAIALAVSHRPDVALVDVQMPGGGGLHATQQIAGHSPRTAIVILSGDEEHSAVLELLAAGAVSYLRKGGSVDELVARLHASIDAHAALAA
ncbi:MAG TPA: response regulator transcription factor [Solirubrobacteraceae bacterium]|nr:response regulator transcription factor [Solirubrobacteraceae bacterium]